MRWRDFACNVDAATAQHRSMKKLAAATTPKTLIRPVFKRKYQ